jgi:imidazole glycerol-phosphate synthase subunit HisH
VASRRPRVVVLDYGSGNLRSAQRALQRAGADVQVTADSGSALGADGLLVPGVGAFAACMAGLMAVGGDQVIRKRVAAAAPVLGICVGMQILFESGDEHGERTAGCGCWPGEVRRLRAAILPHMGWNVVVPAAGSRLLAGLGADARFYFVHSYAITAAPVSVSSWARHGEDFVAVVEDGPLVATQFHPEKSSDTGAALLANWLQGLR